MLGNLRNQYGLIQLNNNEQAIQIIIEDITCSNYEDIKKIEKLEYIKEQLDALGITEENRLGFDVEVDIIKQSIKAFDKSVVKSESSSLLSVACMPNNPKLAPSFNAAYGDSTSTSSIYSTSTNTNKREREENECERESKRRALAFSALAASSFCDSGSIFQSQIILNLSKKILSFMIKTRLLIQQKYTMPFSIATKDDIIHIEESHNSAYFKIPLSSKIEDFVSLNECWCTNSLDRSKEGNTRTKMEENIINTIKEQVPELTKIIRLINIGSDHVGLLVILSKLYLLGYKNIDIINLEQEDRKMYPYQDCLRQDYCKLLTKIFSDATYNFLEVYSPKDTVNLNKDQISKTAELTVFFAEDLGGLDDDKKSNKYLKYNINYRNILQNAVNQVTSLLSSAEQNLVFYSLPSGEIKKQQNIVAQPAACTM